MNGTRIRVSALGRSVRVSRHRPQGTCIGQIRGRPVWSASRLTIQTGLYRHFVPVRPWCYLNHHCEPSCDIRIERRRVLLFTRRALSPGDELTFDYATTERRLFVRCPCRCGAARCRRLLVGCSALSSAERIAMEPRLLPYLRRLYNRRSQR